MGVLTVKLTYKGSTLKEMLVHQRAVRIVCATHAVSSLQASIETSSAATDVLRYLVLELEHVIEVALAKGRPTHDCR